MKVNIDYSEVCVKSTLPTRRISRKEPQLCLRVGSKAFTLFSASFAKTGLF